MPNETLFPSLRQARAVLVRPRSARAGRAPASIRLHRALRDGGEEIGRTELTNLSRRAWRQPRTALLSGGNLGLRSARLTSDAYDGAVPRVNL